MEGTWRNREEHKRTRGYAGLRQCGVGWVVLQGVPGGFFWARVVTHFLDGFFGGEPGFAFGAAGRSGPQTQTGFPTAESIPLHFYASGRSVFRDPEPALECVGPWWCHHRVGHGCCNPNTTRSRQL